MHLLVDCSTNHIFHESDKKAEATLSNGTNIAIRKIEPRSKMDVSKTKQVLILTRNERI